MKITRRVLDKVLLVLTWALGVSWLLFISLIIFNNNIEPSDLSDSFILNYLFEYTDLILFIMFISNICASLTGLFILFATDIVKQKRVTWLLSFILGLAIGANIFLIPIFRHYVVNERGLKTTNNALKEWTPTSGAP